MKSFPNEHTVRGRPTLKDVKRFRNGSSPSITRDQFTSEHFQFIKNQVILNGTKGSNNLGYQFFILINGILRGVIVFLEVIVK